MILTKGKEIVTLILLLCLSSFLAGQSIADLQKQLERSTDNEERMYLSFEIAKKANSPEDKIRFIRQTNDLAFKIRDYDMQSRASIFLGELLMRKRQEANAQKAYENALNTAKKAKNIDLFIQAVDRLGNMKVRQGNHRGAYQTYKDNFDFLSKSGVNLLDAAKEEAKVRSRSKILTKESDRLERERKKLLDAIIALQTKQKDLEKETGALKTKTKVLEEENKHAQEIIDSTTFALDSVSQEKLETEEFLEKKERMIRALNTEKQKEALVRKQLEQENQLKELALDKQNLVIERNRNFRIFLIALSLLVLGLALSLFLRFKAKQKANKELEGLNREIKREQEKSEELLLNILPEPVAEELKVNNRSEAKHYKEASVLFTDFKNFTRIAEKMKPEELVQELDECFRAFDYIIAEHNIEKIKTIGDSYMCANGISDKPAKPQDLVQAAIKFQEFLNKHKKERIRQGKPHFEARIGIHTGPVVAGVVGVKKFAYDIWGDTVNIASRMESASEPGQINISDSTYWKVKYDFDCKYRGELEVKNKGKVKMYYVRNK